MSNILIEERVSMFVALSEMIAQLIRAVEGLVAI